MTGEIRWLYFFALERPYRLAVRTPPFHGGGTGSIPVRVAIPPIVLCGVNNFSVQRQVDFPRAAQALTGRNARRETVETVIWFRVAVGTSLQRLALPGSFLFIF